MSNIPSQQHGLEYSQNDDVITKWLADAFRGQTLEMFGIKSGRIEEVFGFEPVDIKVTAERVDLMLRDEAGALFHLEEQRHLRTADLYRCAAYHFLAARQWGAEVTDIILASGDALAGPKRLKTRSGTYTPVVIDFTRRDGRQRLREIRHAVEAGTFDQWLELVFVPLYGTVTGVARAALVEQVVRFESELYQTGRLSARLLAATLIMSNKLIDKTRLYALWEEMKMLDILEIAEEKGMEKGRALGVQEGKTLGLQEGKTLGLQEGKTLGLQEGKALGLQEGKVLVLDAMRDMVLEALLERFDLIPAPLSKRIRAVHNQDVLKGLLHQALKCQSLQEFDAVIDQVNE